MKSPVTAVFTPRDGWEVRPCYLQSTGNRTSWDICHPAEPDASGVCVVASVFEGEEVARLIASAPTMYSALERLAALSPAAANAGTAEDLFLTVRAIAETALAEARGESGQ